MKQVLVVYNPDAGRKKAIKYKKTIIRFLFKHAEKFKFVGIDELETTDTNDFDTVLVLGGDGTVNKVLPIVIEGNKTLGIIPCGTANLLSAKLGISTNLNKALKTIEKGKIQSTDILKAGENLCVLRCGVGYDADIICKTPQSLKNRFGYFAYFVAGILFALRLKKKQYVINLKEEHLVIDASCIIVANAPNMYKNLISVGKESRLDDGLAEVFILKTTNPILFFFELLRMAFNLHKTNRNAMYLKTDSISIKNKWTNAHIDGEKRNFKGKLVINILEQPINIICS